MDIEEIIELASNVLSQDERVEHCQTFLAGRALQIVLKNNTAYNLCVVRLKTSDHRIPVSKK